MEAGDSEPYAPCTIPAAPPLVADATTLPGGKRVTGFSDIGPDIYRKTPLWAGSAPTYPALRIPMQNTHLTAPYESSSLATPYSGGTMDAGHFGQFMLVKITAEKPYNQASPERAVA